MATFPCTQCGHVNEGERVYCHKCGVKLDRALIPADSKPKQEAADQVRKRVKKLVNPASGMFARHNITTFINIVACAAVIAVLVQIARPPDNIPEPIKDTLSVPQIADRLEDKMAEVTSQQIAIPENAINGYLQTAVKSKDQSGSYGLQFGRAYVHLDKGICNINMQIAVSGYMLNIASYYTLAIAEGGLHATNVGGALGRLPVHPMLMKYLDGIFKNLWDALKREKRLLDQAQKVEVVEDPNSHDWKVLIVTKPGGKFAPPQARSGE